MEAIARKPVILQQQIQEIFRMAVKKNYHKSVADITKNKRISYSKIIVVAGGATALLYGLKSRKVAESVEFHNKNASLCFSPPSVQALQLTPKLVNEDNVLKGLKLNHRERRFMKFASVEHHGQLYMTPQDFIESVTDSEPRPRLKRRVLTEQDIEKFVAETPSLSKGSPHMFRTIYDKGVVSYTEYLFLLSILTKPQTGFRIAFNMFDTDGNQRVDKGEFLVLEKIFSTARRDRLNRAMEGVAKSSSASATSSESYDGEADDVEDELQKCHPVDTMILVHFFGKKGKQDLKYEEFKTFMENLQTEVLEIEFNEFSKGLPTISELDFAKILLRYTYLQSDQYEMFLDRLLDRLPEEKGISFTEFKSFCQFLNTLDDFAIAMKMYTLADHPISQDEFHRAVKICTGQELSSHIVDTVFKIFDEDGDGQLSYKEFIAIMRNRLHRGFKHNLRSEGWDAFKYCVKSEMKIPS